MGKFKTCYHCGKPVLSKNALEVYAFIEANLDNGEIAISMNTIASCLDLGLSTVFKSIKKLKIAKLIKQKHMYLNTKKTLKSVYIIKKGDE